jgi:transposase-like protein
MQDDSRKGAARQAEPFGADTIEARMRGRIRETIEVIVDEELEAVLGAAKSARVGATREGYRHGTRERTLTTSLKPAREPGVLQAASAAARLSVGKESTAFRR